MGLDGQENKRFYLTIEEDAVVAYDGGEVPLAIEDLEDFLALKEQGKVSAASSIDFPEEATKNESVIALCQQIKEMRDQRGTEEPAEEAGHHGPKEA
jgi:hypothetical protein